MTKNINWSGGPSSEDLGSVWYGLVLIGISNIVGNLKLNPLYTYILSIYVWFVNTSYWYTKLSYQTVLFLTIQFSINQRS